MKRTTGIAFGAVAATVVVAGAAVGVGGVWSSSGDAFPPCRQLPTTAEADAALARNQLLAADLEALGKGIVVDVGSPCPPGQDRALVTVVYRSGAQHDAIAVLLNDRDGFGVPVRLVEK